MHRQRHPPFRIRHALFPTMAAGVLMLGAVADAQPQVTKLTIFDGTSYGYFGQSVDLDGEVAIVGAAGDNDRGPLSGSAYIFAKNMGGVWLQAAKLTASDGATNDLFGWRVALSGSVAIVGSLYDDDLGSNSGSAYIFEKAGNSWTQRAKLHASDGEAGDLFGWDVEVRGNVAFVGAPGDENYRGAVYQFIRSGGTWAQARKFVAADGAAHDVFGNAVACDGNTLVVGADGADDETGRAFVFERVEAIWQERPRLVSSDGQAGDGFGFGVAVDGDVVVVGAHGDDDLGIDSGSAYVFERIEGVWTQAVKVTASDGDASDFFGYDVDVSGNMALIGAWHDAGYGFFAAGSAYVFQRTGATWTEADKLNAPDAATSDLFGTGVALSGDTGIVGAPHNDDHGTNSGSAYVWRGLGGCPQDLNRDGRIDTQDFIAFLNAWASRDPIADWNNDGLLNTLDFINYLNDYVSGCP